MPKMFWQNFLCKAHCGNLVGLHDQKLLNLIGGYSGSKSFKEIFAGIERVVADGVAVSAKFLTEVAHGGKTEIEFGFVVLKLPRMFERFNHDDDVAGRLKCKQSRIAQRELVAENPRRTPLR
jgi:hypothetical protein